MRFRVRYHRPQDLVADHDRQITRGGLLVCVDPAPAVERDQAVAVDLVAPSGAIAIAARVIQVLPGAGVAVGFSTEHPGLARLVEDARAMGSTAGPPPQHEALDDAGESRAQAEPEPRSRSRRAAPAADAFTRVKSATAADKIQLAKRGNKDERAAILRDTNRTLHKYVLQNPQLQVDEVAHMARMTTVAPEILTFIAGRGEWARRPEIALALVRNPKTPVPLAIQLLAHVSPAELRQLAKASGVREPIQRAARKKVLG